MSMIQSDLLLGQEGGAGYVVQRSLRFSSIDSAFLSRTPSSSGNRRTWTFATWIKGPFNATDFPRVLNVEGPSSGYRTTLRFTSGSLIEAYSYDGSNFQWQLTSSQVFRDPSAWFHLVLAVDTTQATSSNRVKLYINGAQVTAFSTANYPSLNFDTAVNHTSPHTIGGGQALSAYLADVFLIDGQALTPSSFTEVSGTTGQLIPKKYSGPTPTGNSFWLPFSDNSAATGTALGKDGFLLGNNWTPNNIQVASSSTTNWTSRTSISSGSIWGWSYLSWIFDVNTATGTHSQGAITYSFSPGIPASGSLRLNIGCNVYHDPNVMIAVSINGAGYGTFPGAVAWRTIGWAGGTINSITLQGTNSGNAQALETFLNAIEVNGVQLIDNAAAQNDSLVDTPTSYGTDTGAGGEVRGNYATLNPLANGASTLSNGNLDAATSTTINHVRGTIGVTSGKWYWECTVTLGQDLLIGYVNSAAALNQYPGNNVNGWSYYANNGFKYNNGGTSYGASYTTGDVVGVAFDADVGSLTFCKNGVSQGVAFTGLTSGPYFPAVGNGGNFNRTYSCNFGQRPFAYTAPSGFKALCDQNLPAPTIARPSTVMDVKLYTGNGSTQTISGLGFSPDLVWIKARGAAAAHNLYDIIRGTSKPLYSNLTNAEATNPSNYGVSAFNSDGFSVSDITDGNYSVNGAPGGVYSGAGAPYVAWTWDAGSSTVTNTQGSITSQVRANPSAGFSIVSWTGGGVDGSVGHGLGVAPKLYIYKNRSAATNWGACFTMIDGSLDFMYLNLTNAKGDATQTPPSSSVIYLQSSAGDVTAGNNYIAYCFAPVAGYSSFGSYVGNGSADGPFVYTGFRPRWVMYKSSSNAYYWVINDAARDSYNASNKELFPNDSLGETVVPRDIDFLSNGFKLRNTGTTNNQSGATYIYAAFAESPFQYARAR